LVRSHGTTGYIRFAGLDSNNEIIPNEPGSDVNITAAKINKFTG
jgi:hypothetical protein